MFVKEVTNGKLPPTSDVLLYHVKHSYYQALVWCQAHVQQPVLLPPETMGWKMEETSLIPELSSLPPVPKACEELISCTCSTGCSMQNKTVQLQEGCNSIIAFCICKTSGESCRNIRFWQAVDLGIKVTVAWHCLRPFKRLYTSNQVWMCFQIIFRTTQYTY